MIILIREDIMLKKLIKTITEFIMDVQFLRMKTLLHMEEKMVYYLYTILRRRNRLNLLN